ncbi:hypothetical protein NQ317_019853 [Molorchus minor]|uniref:Uncharacterized protein n=1 Tax=Molorchus minor TaxID=1323400 RepID=A0ABQ9JY56_9CUCU|nr:hypothetical protein NQ317_019853 [Molorchus minor]
MKPERSCNSKVTGLKPDMMLDPITADTKRGDEVWLYNRRGRKEDRPNSRRHGKALILLSRGSTIWFIESNEDPERK